MWKSNLYKNKIIYSKKEICTAPHGAVRRCNKKKTKDSRDHIFYVQIDGHEFELEKAGSQDHMF